LSLLYFLGASILLSFAPGPDNTFVIAQGLSRGRKAAVVTALGMCSGVSVHTTAAALGVSALLYSSTYAFAVLKYAGAAYLLFLAYKALREHGAYLKLDGAESPRAHVLFRRGFIMNALNPKVALFFLAFLPQFVTPGGYSIPIQMMVLGLIFMLQATAIFTGIGLLSGSVGNVILQRPSISRYFAWMSAGIFTALGVRLALANR